MSKTINDTSSDYFEELRKQFAAVDSRPKNRMFPIMYDIDTSQGMPNFILPKVWNNKVINNKIVRFEGDLAYDEIIYDDGDGHSYAYRYALIYNKKLVALGECPGRIAGGLTDILINNPNALNKIARLKQSNISQDRELFDRIKDMEIACVEDMPTAPTTVYHCKDDEENNYYINNNNDGTHTLWNISPSERDERYFVATNLREIREKLFSWLFADIMNNIENNEK